MDFKKLNIVDCIYFFLPLVLWPLTFIVFANSFVYVMALAEVILLIFTLYRYRQYVRWIRTNTYKIVAAGIIGAVALYLIFFAGYYLSYVFGAENYVTLIYALIYQQNSKIVLILLLAFIGVAEEIYWRGGIQGYAEKNSKIFKRFPWVASTAYYAAIHLSTLNPILALAALFVGLVNGIIAYKYGILASSISHVIWIETIIIFLPVIAIAI